MPDGAQGLDRYAYVNNNPLRYIDPTGHEDVEHTCYNLNDPGCIDKTLDEESGLNGINNTETTNNPPHPDAPPDVNNPLPTGNPPPPHVDGLPDDQWEWNDDWLDLGPGYRNKKDPTATVWRPDNGYTNRAGNEGEMPHWHGRAPGVNGEGILWPPKENYRWGRPGQRQFPGVPNPQTGLYEFSPNPNLIDFESVGVSVVTLLTIRIIRIIASPACGLGMPVCAFSP